MVIFENHFINAAVLSWLLAQLSKGVLVLLNNKTFDLDRFVGAGGMPSSHSALVSSIVTMILITEGLSSPLFAVTFIFAFIVLYDAAGVRYAVGEQAKILNQIIKNWNNDDQNLFDKRLKELLGHTKVEVFVGSCLGVVTTLLYHLIVKE